MLQLASSPARSRNPNTVLPRSTVRPLGEQLVPDGCAVEIAEDRLGAFRHELKSADSRIGGCQAKRAGRHDQEAGRGDQPHGDHTARRVPGRVSPSQPDKSHIGNSRVRRASALQPRPERNEQTRQERGSATDERAGLQHAGQASGDDKQQQSYHQEHTRQPSRAQRPAPCKTAPSAMRPASRRRIETRRSAHMLQPIVIRQTSTPRP